MNCIFCGSEGPFSRIEHIIPESLGNTSWAILNKELVCDKCNQYFSKAFEKEALDSFPFKTIRTFLGIPTKKHKASMYTNHLGNFTGTFQSKTKIFHPFNEKIARIIAKKRTFKIVIIAEPEEKLAVCRLLVKMGIEWIAKENIDLLRKEKFEEAIRFCRAPIRGQEWMFMIDENKEKFLELIKTGFKNDNDRRFGMEYYKKFEVWFFEINFVGIKMVVPLESCKIDKEIREKNYKCYNVKV